MNSNKEDVPKEYIRIEAFIEENHSGKCERHETKKETLSRSRSALESEWDRKESDNNRTSRH